MNNSLIEQSSLIGNKQRKTRLQKIIEKILNFHIRIKKKYKKEKYTFKEIDEYDEEEINTNYVEKIYDPFPLLNITEEEEVIINMIENKLTEVIEIIEEYESSEEEEEEEKEEKKEEDLLDFLKNSKYEEINFFE